MLSPTRQVPPSPLECDPPSSDRIHQQYDRIAAHQLSESQARHDANALIFNARGPSATEAESAATGIEPGIVEVLNQTGLQGFGFVVFRIRHGTDDDDDENKVKWEEMKSEWPMLANDGRIRDEDNIGGGHQAVDEHGRAWPVWKWVDGGDEEEDLNSLDVDAIARRFGSLKAQGEVPAGLDQGVVLAVTSECLSSFNAASASASATALALGPWVYAVDVINHSDGGDEEDLKGYFKVSLRSLLPDLWPVLASGAQTPDALEAMLADREVWDGIL